MSRAFTITGCLALLLGVSGLLFWRESVGDAGFVIGLCLLIAPLCALGALVSRAHGRRQRGGALMFALLVAMGACGLTDHRTVAALTGLALLLAVFVALAWAFEPDYRRGRLSASQTSSAASEPARTSQPSSSTPATEGTPITRIPAATAASTPGRESSSAKLVAG